MMILDKRKNKEQKKKQRKKEEEKKVKTWNLEDSTCHRCPHASTTVNIPLDLYNEIMKVYLFGLQKGIEVSIYARIENNWITAIHVPDQENGISNVGINETVPLTWNCIIHSHPGDIKQFSQQDWLTLLVNRDCCLLINQGKFTDGKYRIVMPCGSTLYSEVTILTEDSDLGKKIRRKIEAPGKFVLDESVQYSGVLSGYGGSAYWDDV